MKVKECLIWDDEEKALKYLGEGWITSLLNPQTNNLSIAMDDHQNIYERQGSWKASGVQARGRIHKISFVYRNTKEITAFTSRFLGKDMSSGNGSTQTQLELFPDYFDFSGPKPEIQQFSDIESIVRFIPEKISDMVAQDGCPYSEIAILYTTKNPSQTSETSLPSMIEKVLQTKGIPCSWTAENVSAKKHYDITTNSVSISTIHSAKGFDYTCVFLIGLDFLESGSSWTQSQIDNLTYVAITRARYRLFIPFVNKTQVLKKLMSSL